MKPTAILTAMAMAGVLAQAAPSRVEAQLEVQLPFPLREMMPRIYRAAGGHRAWSSLRDLSILQTRVQVGDDGKDRASERIEIYLQCVLEENLLMVRFRPGARIHQAWWRDWHWMVDQGLRVRDRSQLESARSELLETLLLDRMPFSLEHSVTGPITYEGEFAFQGRNVHRLRLQLRDFPASDLWLLADAATYVVRAVGYYQTGTSSVPPPGGSALLKTGETEPGKGAYIEVTYRRYRDEAGVQLAWLREHRRDGALFRRDEILKIRGNRWFESRQFAIETYLEGRSEPGGPVPIETRW